MNRIYRRIWSVAKQCWVVGSEFAKTVRAASSQRRKGAQRVALFVAFQSLAGGAHAAAVTSPDCSAEEEWREGCLYKAATAPGVHAFSLLSSTTPLITGAGAIAIGQSGTGFGNGIRINGNNSSAFGNSAETYGVDNVAIGYQSKALGGHSVGLGANSRASGFGSTSLGNNSGATRTNAVALGSGALAQNQNSVALGANAITNEDNVVSVGSSSEKRRIVNVQDARLSAGSTDAVTGKQLYATEQKIGSLSGMLKAGSHADSFVIGTGSVSASANAVSVGSASRKRKIQYIADGTVGANSTDAITGNQLHATNQAVTKAQTAADAAATTASAAKVESGKALAETAVLGGLVTQTAANGSVRLGQKNSGTQLDVRNSANANRKVLGVADGAVSATSNEAVTGKQLYATEQKIGSLNGMLKAGSYADSFVIGTGSVSASANSVSVGSASRKRKIQYIADGVVGAGSTDAITGNQLHTTNQAVIKAQTAADGATTTANTAKVESGKALAETMVLGGLVNQTAANGSVRLGQKNSGTQLDVRNSANANRRIMGVADGAISATSNEAVTGKQLHETNANVTAAQTAAAAAKVSADKALAETGVLSGLVGQVAVNGNVRVGEKNSGTVLDVRNSANVNRKLTGVADGAVSASSYEAVNGRQLNTINDKVAAVEGIARSAGTEAAAAKTDAIKALTETAALGGLVAQASASGSVRLGEKNSGTTLDVRNSANASRKISGVADGSIDASSTEAVSGRQLYGSNSRISALESASEYVSVGTDSFSQRAEAGSLGVAIGDSAKAGTEGATALGALSLADGINSVAIGRGSTVSKDSLNGFAMGAGAQVEAADSIAIGAGAKVRVGATGAMAIGSGAEATESNTASFGTKDSGRRLVHVARGTADHNATTVSQLNDSLAALGGDAGMDGNGNIIAPTYTLQGGTQSTVEDALMALDGAVITAGRRVDKVEGQLSSIFQDSPSARADGVNQIALNGVNGMVLTNLADGRVAPGSRDAVTGNQLYAAEQKISQNRNDLEAMRKKREMGQQVMRGLDASVIDYGGARLTGVAEAKLSADSSDVVRGSQLYETNSRVSALEGISQYVSVGKAPEYGPAQAGAAGLAIGNLAKTGIEGGTAIGTFAQAMGRNSIALGRASTVYEGSDSSFAIGTGAEVGRAGEPGAFGAIAFGVGSRVEPGAHGSIALGTSSYAAESGVASFGNAGMKRRLVNIANGTANHNAATVGQLRGALSALGGEVDANGNIVGPSFNVQGQSQSTLNGALEALDGAVVTTTSRVDKVETQLRSVFQDAPSIRADGATQLTLAGANGMVISNVANGLIAAGSRDAVNGGQLHSMQQQLNGRMDGLEQRIDDAPAPHALASSSLPKPQTEDTPVPPEGKDPQQVASVGEGDKPTPQPKAKQDDTPKPQVDTAELEKMLARANEYTDGAISNVERRLDKMDKRFNRMAAMSSAQTAMAMNTAGLATYNRLGAGVGYAEGESAMAVGYQRVLNEKGSATFSLNGAFTNSGERSMGVGVGIGW
ncbi:MAG: ESPR-type extended signal peptide-containing protein [Stenotrophomonas sp.]